MIANADQYFLSCIIMQYFEMHITANNFPACHVCFYFHGRSGWFEHTILLYNHIMQIMVRTHVKGVDYKYMKEYDYYYPFFNESVIDLHLTRNYFNSGYELTWVRVGQA